MGLVVLHDGTFDLTSPGPGCGTTATFALPLYAPPEDDAEQPTL